MPNQIRKQANSISQTPLHIPIAAAGRNMKRPTKTGKKINNKTANVLLTEQKESENNKAQSDRLASLSGAKTPQ